MRPCGPITWCMTLYNSDLDKDAETPFPEYKRKLVPIRVTLFLRISTLVLDTRQVC